MTPELAAFSDWTLALLPRLFLFPGGLSLLIALLLLRAASRGLTSISARVLKHDLLHANLLSIALAWAAVALSPFPGITPLPSPVDVLVLASLPALSLLLDRGAPSGRHIAAAGVITLALILPAVASNSPLIPVAGPAVLPIISSLAVISGLIALAWMGDRGLAGQVRWLAWICLGIAAVWQRIIGDSLWLAVPFTLLAVVILSAITRLPLAITPADANPALVREGGLRTRSPGIYPPGLIAAHAALAIAWLLALLGLLWALLAAS